MKKVHISVLRKKIFDQISLNNSIPFEWIHKNIPIIIIKIAKSNFSYIFFPPQKRIHSFISFKSSLFSFCRHKVNTRLKNVTWPPLNFSIVFPPRNRNFNFNREPNYSPDNLSLHEIVVHDRSCRLQEVELDRNFLKRKRNRYKNSSSMERRASYRFF